MPSSSSSFDPVPVSTAYGDYFPSPRLLPATSSTTMPSPLPFPRRLSTLDSPVSALPRIPSWRSPYLASRPLSLASRPATSTRRFSASSSLMEDVLSPGDVLGENRDFNGAPLRALPGQDFSDVSPELEVVRKLGSGSYAVVYLVREVLSRSGSAPSSEEGAAGKMDMDSYSDEDRASMHVEYGREFALKCLSKLSLVDDEALAAQMTEVTIHQNLPSHDNIVTLHRTFETPAYLLLLLEFVPGEDLFYFLEQARDHIDPTPDTDTGALGLVQTPPTPSLLSNMSLSRTRLRLIASMFAQMCEAVATCHDVGVYHRDIKPENFIVTDARVDGERKVVVKLSDFGLSTMEEDSSDMDCGSAPYMSYECRNNVAPTYKPRAADVWSLGIVLINMLYHINPWTDTTDGLCSSFTAYRSQPIAFFMARFPGMTTTVAEYLSTRIFNILPGPDDDSARATAAEFGAWARNLPDLLGAPAAANGLGLVGHHQRVLSTSGHPLALASAGPVSRPASRAASRNATPAMRARSLSRATESPVLAHAEPELSTILDESQEVEDAAETESRSQSTTKRRKRGARKGKGQQAQVLDDTLETLASASQSLARELSRQKQLPHPGDLEAPAPAQQTLLKKASKWKLSFGKSSSERVNATAAANTVAAESSPRLASATATNVQSLIMGLSPTEGARLQPSVQRGRAPVQPFQGVLPPLPNAANVPAYTAPRRQASPPSTGSAASSVYAYSARSTNNWRTSTSSAATSTSAFTRYSNGSRQSVSTVATSVSAESWRTGTSKRTHVDGVPVNVKILNGIPWELHQLPRGQHPKPEGDIFGQPPPPRARKPRSKLGPIDERPPTTTVDAATSTTDLAGVDDADDATSPSGPKKVQKGQINALAKMLSALRR